MSKLHGRHAVDRGIHSLGSGNHSFGLELQGTAKSRSGGFIRPPPSGRLTPADKGGDAFEQRPTPRPSGSPPLMVVAGIILLLAASCGYALQTTIRLRRLEDEAKRGLDEGLSPATVAMLEGVASKRAEQTLHDARLTIALQMERAAKETLTSAIQHRAREIVKGALKQARGREAHADAGGEAGAEQPGGVVIPPDLVFPDLEEWVKENLEGAVRDKPFSVSGGPPKEYHGPLDLEAAIDVRAEELMKAWRAGGSARSKQPGLKVDDVGDPFRFRFRARFPFRLIRDVRGKQTGIAAVLPTIATLASDDYYQVAEEQGNFWRMKNTGHIVVGISPSERCPWGRRKDKGAGGAQITGPELARPKGPQELLTHVDAWLRCDGRGEHAGRDIQQPSEEEEVPDGVMSASMVGSQGEYPVRLQAFLELAVGRERLAEALRLRRSRPDVRRRLLLLPMSSS